MWKKQQATIETVIDQVWPRRVTAGAVGTCCNRLNNALPPGFPWKLSVSDEWVYKNDEP
jgi:hypothetical protein